MADLFGPFDSQPWAQDQWYRHAPSWAPSGVIDTPAASVAAGGFGFSSSGLTVSIGLGRGWVRGGGYERTATAWTDAVTANATGNPRRDRIVLRRDLAAKTVALARKEGTPAATPVAPALTQVEAGIWEEPLFSFLVPASSGTTITGVIDERVWVDPGGRGILTPRYQRYERTGTGVTPYQALSSLMGGIWVNAPAGDYSVVTTLVIKGGTEEAPVERAGNLEVKANGALITELGARADAGRIATQVVSVRPYTHTGGNLGVEVLASFTGGGGVIYNASSNVQLHYLGRRS